MASGVAYEEFAFPKSRRFVMDYVEAGRRKNHIPVLLELDVSTALELNRAIKGITGEGLSFTGWIAKCIAQAVKEHKAVHAIRRGRKRLVIFQDVDISIPVEETLEGVEGPTKKFPVPYLMREVDRKSVREIHTEIRAAQAHPIDPSSSLSLIQRLVFSFPSPIRRLLIWRRRARDPFHVKKAMGTVALTSVGMFGRGARGSAWGIPIGAHPLIVLLGAIARKPAVVEGGIAARDFLSMTVLFDHDVVDGAPVARFLSRLRELIEGGYGLHEELEELKGQTGTTAFSASQP